MMKIIKKIRFYGKEALGFELELNQLSDNFGYIKQLQKEISQKRKEFIKLHKVKEQ